MKARKNHSPRALISLWKAVTCLVTGIFILLQINLSGHYGELLLNLPDLPTPNSTKQEVFDQTQCLKDVLQHLPIGHGRGKFRVQEKQAFPHHYDAGNDKLWNADMRFKPLPQLQTSDPCSIWEVGAHKRADDSRRLLRDYPHCQFHAYEPVPNFFGELEYRWKGEDRMRLHPYGLAAKPSVFRLDPEDLKGQSTYIGETGGGSIQAQIQSLDVAIREAGNVPPTLLHMNCEGKPMASLLLDYMNIHKCCHS